MSIKQILVPVSGAGVGAAVFETAALVAKRFNGHVEALYVEPDASDRLMRFVHADGDAVNQGELRAIIGSLERAAEDARARFDRVMQTHGIAPSETGEAADMPSAFWRPVADLGPRTLAHYAGLTDLIVVGRPGPQGGRLPEALDAALFATGHLVLVAPPSAPAQIGETILIGWSPTIQTERAIMRAIPFLEQARQVIVLSVTTGAKPGPGPVEAARYLGRHGVRATVREVPPEGRGVGEILLSAAKDANADLLVMGAYSHSRLRELLLGGVTRHVLGHAELPVLMAH